MGEEDRSISLPTVVEVEKAECAFIYFKMQSGLYSITKINSPELGQWNISELFDFQVDSRVGGHFKLLLVQKGADPMVLLKN